MHILQINSSIRGAQSVSTQLANAMVDKLSEQHKEATVQVRQLSEQPHPTLDHHAVTALFTPEQERSEQQQARISLDDALIAQVQKADVLVLGVPMYNFGIPAQLKSWFDAIARAGVTFRYTDSGPEGLLTGKTVYVALARGGIYRDTPNDSQVPYLKSMLGFLGMTDIHWIYAEGLAMGHDVAQAALASAHDEIQRLTITADML